MPVFFAPFPEEHAGDEDLQPNADEDDTAQHRGLAGELCAELFADAQARHAEEEGDDGNDAGSRQRHQPAILRNGKADREGINAGGHALHEEGTGAQRGGFLGFLAPDAIDQHLAADIAQQGKGDPGDERFKGGEHLHDGMDADPACHGHHGLKHAKGACNDAHPFSGHAGVMQTVCHRDRKRVHGKAHAQQCAVEKKQKTPFHN